MVAELAVAEVWRGGSGVEAAADEDAVWAVVLAGRAALQAARLSLRKAAAEVQAGVEAEAAKMGAAEVAAVAGVEAVAAEVDVALVEAAEVEVAGVGWSRQQ